MFCKRILAQTTVHSYLKNALKYLRIPKAGLRSSPTPNKQRENIPCFRNTEEANAVINIHLRQVRGPKKVPVFDSADESFVLAAFINELIKAPQ